MLISIKGLEKNIGHRELFRNLNIQISDGEMIAITGVSGSGKSTLLNIIGLIETFNDGDYLFSGEKVPRPNTPTASKLIRENISYLFQNFALVDYLTVEDNLKMALKYTKNTKDEKQHLIDSTLESVGLPKTQKNKVFELSGGEQQRVAVARTILKPSRLILADEPTGSLDDSNRNEILKLLKSINNSGKTIVIVTHDNEVAMQCDRVISI